jgi:hypothetical protein
MGPGDDSLRPPVVLPTRRRMRSRSHAPGQPGERIPTTCGCGDDAQVSQAERPEEVIRLRRRRRFVPMKEGAEVSRSTSSAPAGTAAGATSSIVGDSVTLACRCRHERDALRAGVTSCVVCFETSAVFSVGREQDMPQYDTHEPEPHPDSSHPPPRTCPLQFPFPQPQNPLWLSTRISAAFIVTH